MKKTVISLAALFTLLATAFSLPAGDALDRAISRHDVAAIGKALDEGADIEARSGIITKHTPLMEAVRAKCAPKERLEMVKLLLDRGAKIEAKDEDGYTVLSLAINATVFDDPRNMQSRHCLPGQEEVIRLLLERGANPNAPSPNSGTVFGMALLDICRENCPVDHLEIIKMLLKKGANPNTKGALEAVLRRSESNVDEVVEMMLEKGATPNPKKEGLSGGSSSVAGAVVYSSRSNATKLLKLLLKKGLDPNAADGLGRPVILFLAEGMEKEDASECKYFEKLLLMLGAGGNPLKLSGLLASVHSGRGLISSYTNALIAGKNRDLPQFLATATPQERAELLTAVEKHQAKMKVQAGRFNEEGRNAIQGGKKEDAKDFRERALEVNAYLDVLKEIRSILEES